MKFTEAKLEQAFIELLENEGFPHCLGNTISRTDDEVLIEEDLKNYLLNRYKKEQLTEIEAQSIILQLKTLSSNDLYESNKKIMRWLADGIIYINGLPVVVFEFKSAIREEATIHNAFEQLTIRYKRDIPELFKYNAFCIISDGVNNKAGSFFAPYEFYYAWRRVAGLAKDVDGIDSLFTLVQGMLNQNRLRDIIQNFIYIPDTSKKDEKIVCRYPQYYAACTLYENIKKAEKPEGDGKGGTYFGATGSGKTFWASQNRLITTPKVYQSRRPEKTVLYKVLQ